MTKKHDIIWLESVDSTNSEARRRIPVIDNLSVVSALEQTRGRGQGNHTWLSPRGENLLISVIVKFGDGEMPAKNVVKISEAASRALVEFLCGYGIEAWIKPPNDIYVGDRKICGMLIENSISGSCLSYSIIGIGLNINQRNFDVSLPNPTSMVLESTKEAYDIAVCLDEFLDIFFSSLASHCGNDR